jgi:hypothetical protein
VQLLRGPHSVALRESCRISACYPSPPGSFKYITECRRQYIFLSKNDLVVDLGAERLFGLLGPGRMSVVQLNRKGETFSMWGSSIEGMSGWLK